MSLRLRELEPRTKRNLLGDIEVIIVLSVPAILLLRLSNALEIDRDAKMRGRLRECVTTIDIMQKTTAKADGATYTL